MPGRRPALAAWLALLALALPAVTALAYVDTAGVDHFAILSTTEERAGCRSCHPGYPLTHASESDEVFASYRCLACHYNYSLTRPLHDRLASSAHRVLVCSDCHDTYHGGHGGRGYDTRTAGYYGCWGSRCHNVVSEDYYIMGATGVTYPSFTPLTALNRTGAKGLDLTAFTYLASVRPGTGVYPSSFVNPLDLDYDTPPPSRLYQECQSCHFAAPLAAKAASPVARTSPTVPHPDNCYLCHARTVGYVSAGGASYRVDPHDVLPLNNTPGGAPWSLCSRCHRVVGEAVASSVHAGVGCRCHGIVHEAGWNRTMAWLYTYIPDVGDVAAPPVPASFDGWRRVVEVVAGDAVPLGPVAYDGNYTHFVLYYGVAGLREPTPVTPRESGPEPSTLRTCFNCHMVPAGLAALVAAGGAPWGAVDPHSISLAVAPQPARAPPRGPPGPGAAPLLAGALLAAALTLAALRVAVRRAAAPGRTTAPASPRTATASTGTLPNS